MRFEFDLAPRLRQILQDELPRVYALARRATEPGCGLYGGDAVAAALPATCPCMLDQITAGLWP